MELGGAKRCGGDFEVFLFYFFIGGWGGQGANRKERISFMGELTPINTMKQVRTMEYSYFETLFSVLPGIVKSLYRIPLLTILLVIHIY